VADDAAGRAVVMHLITPLAAGVAGAGNGTVAIYNRGTTDRAAYYTAFEGGSVVVPSQDIALDANGGLIAYVSGLVDVIVKDAEGTEVRRFVAGANAGAVEVVSPSFTGTDYVTSATGVSRPTTVQSVLDGWIGSAGAPDWLVSVNGVSVTLAGALAAVGSGLLRSVKAPQYGATGDGVTDDHTAFQACLDDGNGIVVVPPGTYLVSQALTVPDGVTVWGAGAGVTVIQGTHPTDTTVEIGATTAATVISGITITGAASSTPTFGYVRTLFGARATLRDCRVVGPASMGGSALIRGAGELIVQRCDLVLSSGSDTAMVYDPSGSAARLTLTDSLVQVQGTTYAPTGGVMDLGFGEIISGTRFVHTGVGSAALVWVKLGASPRCRVTGCEFSSGSSAAVAFDLGTLGTSHDFYESENSFVSVTPYTFTDGNLSTAGRVYLGSRMDKHRRTASTGGGTVTLESRASETVEVYHEDDQAITVEAPRMPAGCKLTLVLTDADGSSAGNATLSADDFWHRWGNVTISANNSHLAHFVSRWDAVNSRHKWIEVSNSWANPLQTEV
jgi:hypothetical protein